MELLQALITTITITLIDCTWTNLHWLYHLRYEQIKPRIEICRLESKEDMKFTLVHELGHYYWFEYLTREQKEEYKKLYNQSNYFFTTNSRIDAEEDFADNFFLYFADDLRLAFKKWDNYFTWKDIINKSENLKKRIDFIWELIETN